MIRVVLCAHNGAQFLEEQLASIMTQLRPVDVVHLFDFASSDGTLELARRLASGWPKLVVREVDHAPGAPLSFFHALDEIEPLCGDDDIIFLSDQDDVWMPEKTAIMLIKIQAERKARSGPLLLFHDVQICDEELHILRPSWYEGRPFRMPRDLDPSRLLIANPAVGHTMAFNKSLLTLALSNLRPKHYVMHDWALALLAAYTGRLIFVDECLSLYRQHGGNILGAGRKKSLFEYMVRANRLSTAVLEQVTAFEEDLDRAVNRRKRIGPLVPGIGPLRWRLASVYLAKGPTLGHRFAAIFPLIKRTASSRLHFRPGGDAIQDEGFSDQYSVGSKLDTIAILGSRGIPARYGGFETLAEQLAAHLNPADVPLAIYGQRSAYSKAERLGEFRGHARRWMPFSASGAQSMLHDALQLGHAALIGRYRNILLLGTSAAWALPTVRLFRPSARVICNIDGLEWRREKFGPFAKAVLKILEAVAVHFSDAVIADNNALAPIVRSRYGVEPIVIAYGGDHIEVLGKGSDPAGYALAIARIEPENNSAMILEGAQQAGFPIHFVGNWTASAYGRELLASYSGAPGCVMEPATYDQGSLAKIRSGSSVYIHGHSVGGTNPSLVEALFHSKRILAFDCSFNRATLEDEGRYFSSAEGLAKLLDDPTSGLIPKSSLLRLRKKFQWSSVSRQYAELFAGNTKSIDCA